MFETYNRAVNKNYCKREVSCQSERYEKDQTNPAMRSIDFGTLLYQVFGILSKTVHTQERYTTTEMI